jgi:phage tail protein X
MNILNVTSRPKTTKGDRIRIVVYFILGIVLALISATVNTNAGFAFAQSAWVLPTVALTFVFGECP